MPKDSVQFLCIAFLCHKVSDVQKILEVINFEQGPMNSLMALSCTTGSLEITKIMMTKSNDIEYCEKEGQTPLLLSIQSKIKNSDIVQYLIEQGANIFAQDNEGRNAFWWSYMKFILIDKKNKNEEEINRMPEAKIVMLFRSPKLLLHHPLNIGRCLDDTTRPLLETFLMCMKEIKCLPKGIQRLIVFLFGQVNCVETLKTKMNIGPKSLMIMIGNHEYEVTHTPDWKSIE